MKKLTLAFTFVTAISLVVSPTMSEPFPGQNPESPDRASNENRPPRRPRPPLFNALDANSDGTISTSEINNASAALQGLDQNNDGSLTPDELHPGRSVGGRGQKQRRPEGRPGGANRPVDKDLSQVTGTIMAFDKNADGKVGRDELPERMRAMITHHDANQDGHLDKQELAQLTPPRQKGPRRNSRQTGEQNGQRPRFSRQGFDGSRIRTGPPAPEQFVQRALEFDADKNGMLGQDELHNMAQELARRGPLGQSRRGGFGPQQNGNDFNNQERLPRRGRHRRE